MEAAISLNLQVFQELICGNRIISEYDIVAKQTAMKIGHLMLKLTQEDHFNSISIPTNLEYANDSAKQPVKRTFKSFLEDRKVPAKSCKSASIEKKVPALKANLPSLSGVQSNVDSFVSINQNMTSGERTFQCTFCRVATTTKGSIKRHIVNTHLPSVTIYKCESCSATAKEKSNMKKHYMNKHKMSETAANALVWHC